MEELVSKKEMVFTLKKQIGEGNFGKVQKCIDKRNNRIVAVKIIDTNTEEQFKTEAELMMKVKSDYTLEILDHFYDDYLGAYILVCPFYWRGSLTKQMLKQWTPSDILLLLFQIQRAFIEITKNNVLHLDLKPDNILLKGEGEYIVCDFGCARQFEENIRMSQCVRLSLSKGGGTTDYAAPEVISKFEFTKYTDIWSLGVITYELIYHQHPLKDKSSSNGSKLMFTMAAEQLMKGKVHIQYPPKQGYEKLIQLCGKMLMGKPPRLTWEKLGIQIYNHIGISKRTVVITDIGDLIDYATNVNTLLSGLIYYIELNNNYFDIIHLDTHKFLETLKQFMVLHIQTVHFALKNPHNNEEYYIFPLTMKSYTDSMKDKLEHILNRTKDYTHIQIQPNLSNYLNNKQSLECDSKDLQNIITKTQPHKNKKEWNKILKALQCIETGIDYKNKQYIKIQRQYMIYN